MAEATKVSRGLIELIIELDRNLPHLAVDFDPQRNHECTHNLARFIGYLNRGAVTAYTDPDIPEKCVGVYQCIGCDTVIEDTDRNYSKYIYRRK